MEVAFWFDWLLWLVFGFWVIFVFWFVVASDAWLYLAQWLWPSIGDGLVRAGVPRSFIAAQLLFGWISLIPLLIVAPLLLWKHYGRRSLTISTIEDSTWTLNLPDYCCRDGVWTAWLMRESIVNPRFQRARFVMAEGPAVLISAADLRRALADWLANANGGDVRPLEIDFECNTVNGLPVEMSSEK